MFSNELLYFCSVHTLQIPYNITNIFIYRDVNYVDVLGVRKLITTIPTKITSGWCTYTIHIYIYISICAAGSDSYQVSYFA